MNAPPFSTQARAAATDCWNRIGVHGDASCPRLAEHIHCRNCPVYSSAAVRLLDIELTAEQLAQATRHVAREKTVTAAQVQSAVVFRVAAEWLALPTISIREIVAPRPVHSLPHRRDGVVLGVANVGGQLLACAELRQILHLETGTRQERDAQGAASRMLVTAQAGISTVFPVDEAYGVLRFSPQDLIAVPRASTAHVRAVLHWQARSVSLLDAELLLSTVNRSLALATSI